jgi:hypothetical protein
MAGNLAPEPHAIAMYRGIDNWRPLLNGYSSYYPREFKEHMALASRLPERAALEALRRSTGLETIVIESEPSTMMLQQPFLEAIRTGILPGVRVGYRDASVLVLELEPAERSPGS